MDIETKIVILIIILVVIYFLFKKDEKFSMIDTSIITGSMIDDSAPIKPYYRT